MIGLKDFMIRDFKIFEGEHWFSFKDLNVFTGPNNAGKSSFIKAMQLFSEGFEKSDFPQLDLIGGADNLGDFKEVVNKRSDQKRFSFGFYGHIRNIDNPFKVIYTFQEGGKKYSGNIGTAPFLSLELIDMSGEVFLGIYDRYKYWGYEDDSPLKSPFTGTDHTSMLNGKLNLHLIKKYAKSISPSYDIEYLWSYLTTNFDNDWWFEAFKEYDGYENTIFNKRFNDLLQELAKDDYSNLANYSSKEDIHFTDSDNIDELNRYKSILVSTNYRDFLSEILIPIFDSVNDGLSVFWIKMGNQIKSSDLLKGRLFLLSKETDFLTRLIYQQDDKRYKDFIIESNNIFGFKEFSKVTLIENSGFTIKLHKIIYPKEKKGDNPFPLLASVWKPDFIVGKLKDDLSDFGKGTINILTLILKVAAIIFHEKDENKDAEKKKKKNFDVNEGRKKIILVEEPEAFLHPDWQSRLADFFTYCINNYDVQFFIETHSEYLIRKLQYLTAKNKIKPEDTVIYYFNQFDKDAKGAEQVKEIKILEDGSLSDDFGPGFFDEATNLKFDLLRLKNPQKN